MLLVPFPCLRWQEFQIYRWNPDDSEKPKYVTYKVDINRWGKPATNHQDLLLSMYLLLELSNCKANFLVTEQQSHPCWQPLQ